MANPNLFSLTSNTLNPIASNLSTNTATSILSNASSSGHAYKIISLVISNNDTASQAVTVNLYTQASLGGTAVPIVSVASIPANSSLTVVTTETPQVLTENTSLGVTAATANKLAVTGMYEDLN